jgi:hypothetical protein
MQSAPSFGLLDSLAKTFQFRCFNASLLDKIEGELSMRPTKKPAYEMTNGGIPRFIASDGRMVNKRPAFLDVTEIPLFFQDAQRRQNGGICQGSSFG